MGEISYKPLIQDMTWSFSRMSSFEDCPYAWYLKYIADEEEDPMFFSSYGSFIHKLLAAYYSGEIPKSRMLVEYLTKFGDAVTGFRPKEETVAGYVADGAAYLKNFTPLPYKTVDVEKKVTFGIGRHSFVGFVDLVMEDGDDLIIVDHKSRSLKERSRRKLPTQNDLLIDEMLKQLYLYSIPMETLYGRLPKYLVFNCFRNGVLIKEPFCADKFEETKRWAVKTVEEIEVEEDFDPNIDFFKCRYLCGLHDKCVYYDVR